MTGEAHITLAEVLAGIDARTIPLEVVVAPTYFGLPQYRAAGWTITVFDDCSEWDYIEWAVDPSGNRYEYPIHAGPYSDNEMKLINYSPAHEEDWGY